MSFPGRPPLVPFGVVTMPMATHMMVGAYSGGGRGALLPAPGSGTGAARNGAREEAAPPVTVFVGNIAARVPDTMVRAMIAACGPVVSWRRAGSFGFAELAGVEAALRAVRLLHERSVAGRALVAKTDGKVQHLVDSYKSEQRSRMSVTDRAPGTDVAADGDDWLDARQRAQDDAAERRLQNVMADYADEINNYETLQKEEAMVKTARVLEEAAIEEDKRDVVQREIGKFRESMKEEVDVVVRRKREREEEKRERDRDKDRDDDRRERDKDRDKDSQRDDRERRRASPSRGKDRERDRERDRDRDRDRDREREKEREREREREKEREKEREERDREREREREKEREKEREREREVREREREREIRERERERERDRDRERNRARSRSESRGRRVNADSRREKEIEEEIAERRRQDKKAREKEAAYQTRLRAWETRERRKAKEYASEKEKERCRSEEREREARKLKEFLEDYDDERDDNKYYRGKELAHRLGNRVREADSDARERAREDLELEELKRRVTEAGEDWESALKQHHAQYTPKLLLDARADAAAIRAQGSERAARRQRAREEARKRMEAERERYLQAAAARQLPAHAEPIDSDDSGGGASSAARIEGMCTPPATPPQAEPATPPRAHTPPPRNSEGSSPLTISFRATRGAPAQPASRRAHAAFAVDDEETTPSANTPAPPAAAPHTHHHHKHGKDKKDKEKRVEKRKSTDESGEKDKDGKCSDEKRRIIKSLIDRIPTQKAELFNYKLDTSQIDATLMEKKVRPWISKKIVEYIGEPEPTLVDFICSKLLAGAAPQAVLDDVQMVLDEEAEVFVVKMWRLLIYELEAKRAGLAK